MHSYNRLKKQDILILKQIQLNARSTLEYIGNKVHLSSTSVGKRLIKLEKLGIVTGYRAVLNPHNLGRRFRAYLLMSLIDKSSESLQHVVSVAHMFPEILNCSIVLGSSDLFLEVLTIDQQHYSTFQDKLKNLISGIGHIHEYVIMNELKKDSCIDLSDLEAKCVN